MRRTFLARAALAGALLLLLQLPDGRALEAGTAQRMGLDELVRASDLVLEARVVTSTAGEDSRGLIHTEHLLSVDRTFVGEARPMRTVRLPGGVLSDGRGLVIPGLPRLRVGEDVFLLLSPASPAGVRMITGLAQGSYRVLTDPHGRRFAVRCDDSLTLVNPLSGSVRPGGGLEVLEYAELVARLTAAAAGGAGGGKER